MRKSFFLLTVFAMVFAVTWAQKPVAYGYRGDGNTGSYSSNYRATWNDKITLVPQINEARISIATNAEAAHLDTHPLVVNVDLANSDYKVVWRVGAATRSAQLSNGVNRIDVNSQNATDFYLVGPNYNNRGAITINSITINGNKTTLGAMEGFATYASNITVPSGQNGKIYLKDVTGYQQLYIRVESSNYGNGNFELVWKKNNGNESTRQITSNNQEINCGNNVQEVYLHNRDTSGDKQMQITRITANSKQGGMSGSTYSDIDRVWTFTKMDAAADPRHLTALEFEAGTKNMTDVGTGNRHMRYFGNPGDIIKESTEKNITDSCLHIAAATTKTGSLPTQGYFEFIPNMCRGNIMISAPTVNGNDTRRFKVFDKDGNQKGEYPYNSSNYIDLSNYTDPYYICFNEAVDIYRIQLIDPVIIPTITNDLEQVYNVSAGQIIEMPIIVSGDINNYSFAWYRNSTKSIVGATRIEDADSNIYYGRTDADGRTAYYFCVVTNKWNPARRYSNIAIVTTTQASAPSAPDLYYEYMGQTTKVSIFNNGNYADIRFTLDGTDPRTSESATTIETYDDVNVYASMEVNHATTVKVYCPKGDYAKASYSKDSYVKTMVIPVLQPGEAVVSWKHKNTYLNTNELFLDFRITETSFNTNDAEDFNCHNLTMTEVKASQARTEANPEFIKYRITCKENGYNGWFDPEIMEFRINKINMGRGSIKYSLTLYDKNGNVKRESQQGGPDKECRIEENISNIVVDRDLGWTDFYHKLPKGYNGSYWRLYSEDYLEFAVYSWDLQEGEGLGLASITCCGKTNDQHQSIAVDNNDFSVPVGETHAINISTGSDGTLSAVSTDEEIATVAFDPSNNKRLIVSGHRPGLARIILSQTASVYSYPHYEAQTMVVNAYVIPASSGSQEYHVVTDDEVYRNLATTDLLNYGSWIKYSGSTTYTNQEVINHISPSTDARSLVKESINLALLANNNASTLDFYVQGAKSIAVYVRHGSESAQITVTEDGGRPQTFNQLTSGVEGTMCCYDLSDNGQHHIQITNSHSSHNVFVYAVKLSPKLSPNLTLTTQEKTLWIDVPAENSWSPTAGTDYSTSTGGSVTLSIPDNSAYVALNNSNTAVTAKAAGSSYLHVNLAATSTHRATSRSVTLQVKRNAESVTTQKYTWDLTQPVINNDELNGLYWKAEYGIVDDRDKSSQTYTRLNGLLICRQSEAHFNLPADNPGGVVSVTYGPRERYTTTSLHVNDLYSKTVLIDDDWIRTKQQSWTIAPGTTKVTLSMGRDFNEGVITSITWTPTDGSASATPVGNSNYPLIDNSTSGPASHDVLTSSGHISWSMLGKDVYTLTPNKTYTIRVPESLCVKKIVVQGTSTDEYDASVISIDNCDAESGQALAACRERISYLEYIPTQQKEDFTLRVEQQSAVVSVELYSYDECRVVKNITDAEIVGKGRLGTVCYNKDVKGRNHNGALFYRIAYKIVNPETQKPNIVFEEVDNLLAGHPYVYVAHDKKLGFDFTSDAEVNEPITESGLIGLLSAHTFTQGEIDAENGLTSIPLRGLYGVTSNSIKKIGAGSTSSSGRAFIRLSEVPTYEEYLGVAHAPARRLGIGTDGFEWKEEEEENVTSLNAIEDWNAPFEGIVDLNGRQMSGVERGIYIHHGRVILVK